MNIDVIILTDSSDVALTQRTIDTLHDSAIYENFCIQLVDSGSNDVNRYKGWTNYIHPESSFIYLMSTWTSSFSRFCLYSHISLSTAPHPFGGMVINPVATCTILIF